MKKHGAFWMHLYPLLLFAIIVLSLLFLVMTGTGLYSAVVDSQTRNREARAALSYLAARVHAADAAGAVSVGEGPEGAALLLRENADGETYETRIYLYEGALREEYGTADAALDPQDSERIVDAKSFSIEQVRPGLLVVSTEYGSADIALRSGLCGNAAFGTLSACQPDRAGADTGCCKAYLTGGQGAFHSCKHRPKCGGVVCGKRLTGRFRSPVGC